MLREWLEELGAELGAGDLDDETYQTMLAELDDGASWPRDEEEDA